MPTGLAPSAKRFKPAPSHRVSPRFDITGAAIAVLFVASPTCAPPIGHGNSATSGSVPVIGSSVVCGKRPIAP